MGVSTGRWSMTGQLRTWSFRIAGVEAGCDISHYDGISCSPHEPWQNHKLADSQCLDVLTRRTGDDKKHRGLPCMVTSSRSKLGEPSLYIKKGSAGLRQRCLVTSHGTCRNSSSKSRSTDHQGDHKTSRRFSSTPQETIGSHMERGYARHHSHAWHP